MLHDEDYAEDLVHAYWNVFKLYEWWMSLKWSYVVRGTNLSYSFPASNNSQSYYPFFFEICSCHASKSIQYHSCLVLFWNPSAYLSTMLCLALIADVTGHLIWTELWFSVWFCKEVAARQWLYQFPFCTKRSGKTRATKMKKRRTTLYVIYYCQSILFLLYFSRDVLVLRVM